MTCEQDKKDIAKNIADQAKYARLLVIWTDCDREGEHIGQEIVDAAKKGNATIQVKRARFSNVERAYEFCTSLLSISPELTTCSQACVVRCQTPR